MAALYALLWMPKLSPSARRVAAWRGGDRAARKVTCIVDGDTVWIKGVKMRLLDIDAPEMQGQCQAETQRAIEAADRLITLIDGDYAIEDSGQKDRTSDRRTLVRVRLRDGRTRATSGARIDALQILPSWPSMIR